MDSNYKYKYLKYKKKYIELKLLKQNTDIQNGGIITELYNKVIDLTTCRQYYNEPSKYKFPDLKSFKDFFNNFYISNQELYKGTILQELIKIDFNIQRYDELPELIKVILSIKLQSSHLLEYLLSKEYVELIKSIFNGFSSIKISQNDSLNQSQTFLQKTKSTLYSSIQSLLFNTIKIMVQQIDKKVLDSIKTILKINSEDIEINEWDALSKLLEFFCCFINGTSITAIDTILYTNSKKSIAEQFRDKLNNQSVQIVFLNQLADDIKIRKKINDIYNFVPDSNNSEENTDYYKNFTLKDFFDPNLNINFYLPPIVLLFLSMKLNPIINDNTNSNNIMLRTILTKFDYICNIPSITDSDKFDPMKRWIGGPLGFEKIKNDTCIEHSNINWRTFDDLLRITTGWFTGTIYNLAVSTIRDEYLEYIVQNLSPYTTFLPIDLSNYLQEKLYLNLPENKKYLDRFNELKIKYESKIYDNFTDVHKDEYYYLNDYSKSNPLSPPKNIFD